jgi:class 3 adenylate cyclase
LPERVAERLKHGEQRIAEQRDGVSVMFIDIVGFTEIAEHTDPLSLVAMLESVFGVFETLCLDHGMLKIKTIGDAFMAVGGVLEDCDDAARRAADTALAMMQAREGLSESYVFRPRGVVELKGIGEQQVRHLLRRTHQDAAAG